MRLVVIADDQTLVREGLKTIIDLEEGMSVCRIDCCEWEGSIGNDSSVYS